MAKIKTRTEYDFKHLVELQQVAYRTFAAKQVLRKKAFCLAWGSCCLGMGAFIASQGYGIILGLLLMIPGVFLMLRYVFFYHLLAWGASRNMKPEQRINDFYFEEKHILACQGKETAKYHYNQCYKLLEAENSFYFIMNNGQGLVLDKQHISGGSVNDLRRYLEDKTGETFVRMKIK